MRYLLGHVTVFVLAILLLAAASPVSADPVDNPGYIVVPVYHPPGDHFYIVRLTNNGNTPLQVAVVVGGAVVHQPLIHPGNSIDYEAAALGVAEGVRIAARVAVDGPVEQLDILTISNYNKQRFVMVGMGGSVFRLNPFEETPESLGETVKAAEVFSLTINVGDTVTWVRVDGSHSVTADDGSFDSGPASDTWEIFSYTFEEAGVFPYHCKQDGGPGGVGMAGIVNVVDDSGPTPSAPAAPSQLEATPVSTTAIELSWRDNATDEEGYIVERSTDGGNWEQIVLLPANSTSYRDEDSLSPGTTYHYRVRAKGVTEDSTSVQAQILLPPAASTIWLYLPTLYK